MAAKPALLVASVLALAIVAPAIAKDGPAWSVEGTLGVVSEYRYRGYSLSGNDPALQGGLTLTHASGFYGDVYLSSIKAYGVGPDGDGAKVEATLTAGWGGSVLGLDVDAAVSAYRYPDGSDVNYFEIPIQVGKQIGAAAWTVGAAYAPEQHALGGDDNGYLWGRIEYAPQTWPVALSGTLGYEDGAYAPTGKVDWALGISAPVGPAVLGVTWIDSDAGSGAVVASAFVSF